MKKLYLVLGAMALAMTAGAKELSFFMGDTPVANESTIYFSNIVKDDLGGVIEVTMDPEISVMSDVTTSDVTITASCLSGQKIQLCAGGACEIGEDVTKTGVSLTAGQKLPLLFHFSDTYAPGETIPTVETQIDGMIGEDDETYFSFTVIMGENVGGIAVIETSKSLKAVEGAVVYVLDGEADFTLYTADGRAVVKQTVAGEGSISTDFLRPGIYVYTLGAEKGKLYIH